MKLPSPTLWLPSLLLPLASSLALHKNHPRQNTDVSQCKLPADPNTYLSVGHGLLPGSSPAVGTQTSRMIFIDFPDAPAPASDTPQSLYDVFMPGAADWYTTSSYGKLSLDVQADMTRGFVRMPVASTSYNWARGLTAELHYQYIQDALDAYAAVGGDLSPVDTLYIVPTTAAAAISFTPTYMSSVSPRSGGDAVAGRCVTVGQDAFIYWFFKVLNHETGHTMGLADLYPLEGGATGTWVGGWDMMCDINGLSPDYFAWDKWRLGWLDDSNFECVAASGSSQHTISAIETLGDGSPIKGVVVKTSSTEALIAEVRSGQGVDNATCGSGVLLYTISTVIPSGYGSIKVIDTTPGSGGCGGEELNDAPLRMDGPTTWQEGNVRVTLLSQDGNTATIQIDM